MTDRKAYMRQFMKTYLPKYHKENEKDERLYLGKIKCPKCKKWGYLRAMIRKNRITNHTYGKKKYSVDHQHQENGKTVYDYRCYLGIKKSEKE